MKQLRMSSRVGVNYTAVFKHDSTNVKGVIEQMSEGGLSFCCTAVLDTDAVGLFTFSAFEGEPPVSVLGELVYVIPGKKGKQAYQKHSQYGVRFVDRENEQHENIIRIVRFATVRQRYSASKKRPFTSFLKGE